MSADDLELRQEISGPGVYPGMPAAQYRGDPAPAKDGGSLSRSGASRLVPPSTPAAFDEWRRGGDTETSDALNFGQAAHTHVLSEGAAIVVVDAADWRTKDARAERDAAVAAGRIAILPKHRAVVEAMAAKLREHPIASQLLAPSTGDPEVSLFWRHPRTERWCRARPDFLRHTGIGRRYVIPDYKTAADASAEAFGKSAADYGYHQQHPWYVDGVKALGIDPDPVFLFIVQEKRRPYLVNVIELDEDAVEVGRRLNDIAVTRFHNCTTAGIWPGYGEGVALASLPPWILRREDISA